MRNDRTPRGRSRADRMADEHDSAFRDLIRGVAVTEEELAAIATMPDRSIRQVKDYLRENKRTSRSAAPVTGMLRALRRRVERGWRALAAGLAAAMPPGHRIRDPRRS